MNKERIFLIGMMGSGKTTLGRQLSARLGYAFVDLDEYIEQREGRSIAQLFEQEGQQRFRELERQALEEVQKQSQTVIATGGGTPCFLNNMSYINLHGTSIFLDVPVAEICRRLQATDLATRPLLAGISDEELNVFIAKTLAERRSYYMLAGYTLTGKNNNIDSLLSLINHK